MAELRVTCFACHDIRGCHGRLCCSRLDARRPPFAGLRKPPRDRPKLNPDAPDRNLPKRRQSDRKRKRKADITQKYKPHPSKKSVQRLFFKQHLTVSRVLAPAFDQRHPARLNRLLTICLQALSTTPDPTGSPCLSTPPAIPPPCRPASRTPSDRIGPRARRAPRARPPHALEQRPSSPNAAAGASGRRRSPRWTATPPGSGCGPNPEEG